MCVSGGGGGDFPGGFHLGGNCPGNNYPGRNCPFTMSVYTDYMLVYHMASVRFQSLLSHVASHQAYIQTLLRRYQERNGYFCEQK